MASSLFPATRWSLVERLDGDRDVTLLIEHYADAVARYLAGKFPELRQRGQIDDLVQEVLLALMRNPHVLRRADRNQGGRFRYLLMRVAANAARNARRKLARHDLATFADAAVLTVEHEPNTEPDADMDRAWARSVIERGWRDLRAWVATGELEPEALTLLERSVEDGFTIRAAAADLGLSLGTAHRRLAKARHLLQRAVVEHLRFAGELSEDTRDSGAYQVMLEAAGGG